MPTKINCEKCGQEIRKKNDFFVLQRGFFGLEILCGICFGKRNKQFFIGFFRSDTPMNRENMKGMYIFCALIAIMVPLIIMSMFPLLLALLGIIGCYFALSVFVWQSKKAADLEASLE